MSYLRLYNYRVATDHRNKIRSPNLQLLRRRVMVNDRRHYGSRVGHSVLAVGFLVENVLIRGYIRVSAPNLVGIVWQGLYDINACCQAWLYEYVEVLLVRFRREASLCVVVWYAN